MSAISRPPNRLTEFKSGGKIVRPRRTTTRPTPYDRPTPRLSPISTPHGPNWLSRFILSPSRLIATGAGKVFSSVFGSESSASSSSSSDVDEEDVNSGSTSEGEMEDVNDGNGSSQSDEKENQTTEIVNDSKKDLPAVEWKTATLRVIAQLLMQETFSREECDRLTHIINSRVVDSPITGGIEDARLSKTPVKTVGNDVDTPDLCNTAVTEAKKWFEGKKLGSNSKSAEYGTCTLNTAPHSTEGEMGSPVDLAKTYMRVRPPWASPTTNHIQLQSPSSMGKELFVESTPFSVSGKALSQSKLNRDFLVTGSWNIQEELRKVRSRATEEMLRTRSSSKMDWSALASAYKGGPSVSGDGEFGGAKNKLSNFTQLIDVPLKWGSAATNSGFTDTQMAQDRLRNDDFPPNAAPSVPEKSQDPGSTLTIEGMTGAYSIAIECFFLSFFSGDYSFLTNGNQIFRIVRMAMKGYQSMNNNSVQKNADAATANGPKDIEETSHPLSSRMERTVQGKSLKSDAIPDSILHEEIFSAPDEVARRDDSVAANGFPSYASSLCCLVKSTIQLIQIMTK
uniref:Protein KAKU4 n=1 Tax=Salix viminalis TaxID=40686 RepID=A0A6N2NJZ2_SALVM